MEDVDISSSPDKDNGFSPSAPSPASRTKSATPPPSPISPSGANQFTSPQEGPGRETRNEVANTETTPTSANKQSSLRGRKINSVKIKKQYSKIYRIKTKILQNLGKADKTTDEVFDEYEDNFMKQQLHANRLHKEIANYLRCARALHGASKVLFETLGDVYEPDWVGHDLIYVQAQNSDMLWTDFCHKMQDQSLAPLTAYVQEFPDLRKKIDKRGRKLVDYDSQRHQLENLQRSARRDEYKVARARDQLETARSTYETLNKDLYDELPSIYDKRIPNSSSAIRSLFAAETTFMQENSKIAQELEAIAEKLGKECTRGTYNSKRSSPPKEPKIISITPPLVQSQTTSSTNRPTISNPIPRKDETGRPYEEIEFEEKKLNGTTPKTNGEVAGTGVPEGATTEGLPPGVLYRVRATYKYTAEDVDELGFDVGETIQVIEYEDPEEQEEGWLSGMKESNMEKGLFPANFTRPI